MHLDPLTGLWKNDDNDYNPSRKNEELFKEIDDKIADMVRESENETPIPANLGPEINCKCTLSIRFEDVNDHARWVKYCASEPRWDFATTYPAIMKAEYKLKNAFDVEMMAKKIVHLLQNGFDVYSASWKIEEKKDA